MAYSGEYAVVDVAAGSTSEGKILVLLDDEATAQEIADELCLRGRSVAVTAFWRRREAATPAALAEAMS